MKQHVNARVFSFVLIVSLLLGALGLPGQQVQAANAGTAIQFDGTNDYVTFGSVPNWTSLGLQTFTIDGALILLIDGIQQASRKGVDNYPRWIDRVWLEGQTGKDASTYYFDVLELGGKTNLDHRLEMKISNWIPCIKLELTSRKCNIFS